MPMGMLGNKSFAQVLVNSTDKKMNGPKKDGESSMEMEDEVNKDQAGIDAAKQLISSMKSGDAERAFRSLKIIFGHCNDCMESENESESESEDE